MNALEHNRFTEAWPTFRCSVPRPRAIGLVSLPEVSSIHWRHVTARARLRREPPMSKSVEDCLGSARAPSPCHAMPCTKHFTRGTCACRIVVYWQTSRCRQPHSRRSYPLARWPQVGQANAVPAADGTCTTTLDNRSIQVDVDAFPRRLEPRNRRAKLDIPRARQPSRTHSIR